MLGIRWLRAEPEVVRAALAKRDPLLPTIIDAILEKDEERRTWVGKVDDLKAERNAVSKRVGELKRLGENAADLIARMR